MVDTRTHYSTIVIGGGQAGLATGYHLAQQGADFVILNAEARVGDEWRRRWDSLRLFTPARHSSLPGLPHPKPRAFLSKDEVANYLERYAQHFELPVRHGVTVTGVRASDSGFVVTTSAGMMTADSVVIASGATTEPAVPEFASALDADIRQLHSSEYRNPDSVLPGTVLVVGAGNSGVEIAIELAASHQTLLAGRPTAHIPDALFTVAGELYWNFIYRVLTIATPIGRKVAPQFHSRGAPLIRVSMKDAEQAGVQAIPRISGVSHGMPISAGSVTAHPTTIIWATGFRPGLTWIDGLPSDESGLPDAPRGVVTSMPGLYFVGMPFQFSLTSQLLGGVGRDAKYVTDQISRARDVTAP
ncbi:MAG: NAD(P)-binding domain-containing protein [Salinibacterium sp.]|nr:NAD(P)-binding domain-containing protein [Salinibacterium sp.]